MFLTLLFIVVAAVVVGFIINMMFGTMFCSTCKLEGQSGNVWDNITGMNTTTEDTSTPVASAFASAPASASGQPVFSDTDS